MHNTLVSSLTKLQNGGRRTIYFFLHTVQAALQRTVLPEILVTGNCGYREGVRRMKTTTQTCI